MRNFLFQLCDNINCFLFQLSKNNMDSNSNGDNIRVKFGQCRISMSIAYYLRLVIECSVYFAFIIEVINTCDILILSEKALRRCIIAGIIFVQLLHFIKNSCTLLGIYHFLYLFLNKPCVI